MQPDEMHTVGSTTARGERSSGGRCRLHLWLHRQQPRLRLLAITCPTCGDTQVLDTSSPPQIFDPEFHRFACPSCLEVVRLVPYPLLIPDAPGDTGAAIDLTRHPSCAALGVYAGLSDAGVEQIEVAQYLYFRPPTHPIC